MRNGLFDIFFRSMLSFVVLVTIARIMGKKQISQLTFFDYVVGISIGSIAANFAVDETVSYAHGLMALIVYGILPIIISYISMKSIWARRILGGVPTILVQNGQILEKNLHKSKFNINDLLEELRIKGAFNLADVEFAILETGGKLSLQLKSQKQPLTPSDLNISTRYNGLTANLIIDGEIMYEHLSLVSLDKKWLINELERRKIYDIKSILLATLDTNGNFVVIQKDISIKENKVLE